MSFVLNFAPHLGLTSPADGLFVNSAGPDPVDQIRFAYDLGFRAIEDNFLRLRPIEDQKRIGETVQSLGMVMGCFLSILVHDRPTFALEPSEVGVLLRSELTEAIQAAHRSGGRHLTIIAGRLSANRTFHEQMENTKRNLLDLAEMAERENVVLLVEAISRKRWPDVLIKHVAEAFDICAGLQSPALKVLFDIYQCQCEAGDLIQNLDRCWDQIGCIQIADNPGRCEPGSGEINYQNVLSHIRRRGWRGLVELEHAARNAGVAGERAVIDTYLELNRKLEGVTGFLDGGHSQPVLSAIDLLANVEARSPRGTATPL